MRKLKLQMQVSLDGFVSTGPNDGQQWVTWAWDEISQYVLDLHGSCDSMIIGRKLAVDFIPYWQDVVTRPDEPMQQLAKHIVEFRKYVFSGTLTESPGTNSVIVNGDLTTEVNALKKKDGRDILVVGGGSFVSSLVSESLIDEYHLFLNPVVLGKGISIFEQLTGFRQLTLNNCIRYPSGIVLLCYGKQ